MISPAKIWSNEMFKHFHFPTFSVALSYLHCTCFYSPISLDAFLSLRRLMRLTQLNSGIKFHRTPALKVWPWRRKKREKTMWCHHKLREKLCWSIGCSLLLVIGLLGWVAVGYLGLLIFSVVWQAFCYQQLISWYMTNLPKNQEYVRS